MSEQEARLYIEISLEEVQLLCEVGQVYYLRGEYAKAEKVFRGALVLSPGNGDLYSAVGAALQAQGRQDEAIAMFEQALNACPSEPSAKVNRGELFMKMGELDAAQRELNAAIELDGGQTYISERARVLLQLIEKMGGSAGPAKTKAGAAKTPPAKKAAAKKGAGKKPAAKKSGAKPPAKKPAKKQTPTRKKASAKKK